MTIKPDAANKLLQFLDQENWEFDYGDSTNKLTIRHVASGNTYELGADGTLTTDAAKVSDEFTDPNGTTHTGALADISDIRTDEEVEDVVAALIQANGNLSANYDDANDLLKLDTSGLNTEEVEDAVASLITTDSNLSVSYDDANDTLTVSLADSISVTSLDADEVSVNNIGASFYLGNTQTISDKTTTKIQFDNENYDENNEFDTVNHKFVANNSGYYIINIGTSWVSDSSWSAGDRIRVNVYVNGSERDTWRPYMSSAKKAGTSHTTVINISASDEIDLRVRQNSGSSQKLGGSSAEDTWAKIHKIA